MSYSVEYSDTALKKLKKTDRFEARLIISWIDQNLQGCTDPRVHGKGLTANRSGEWRYRIGSYRVLCIIEDNRLIIEVFLSAIASTLTDRSTSHSPSRTPRATNGRGAHAEVRDVHGPDEAGTIHDLVRVEDVRESMLDVGEHRDDKDSYVLWARPETWPFSPSGLGPPS